MNKKWLILIAVVALGLVTFLVTAYSNGKTISSEPSISFVSHTEYWSGDNASTIVRLVDYKGDPFENVQGCVVDISYPNKTPFVTNQPLQISSIAGNWYRTDLIPSIEGTYEQGVTCTYLVGSVEKTTKASQSFHVNPALNFIKTVNTNVLAADAHLGTVNVAMTAMVENRTANLSNQLTLTQADLNSLIGKIHDSISQNISSSNADLNTNLSKVNISIQGKIASTGQDIVANITYTQGNLTDLLNQINNSLSSQLASSNSTLNANLSGLTVHIDGKIDGAKAEIISAITASNTNLNDALALAKSDLSTQITNTGNDLNTTLKDVNTTITTQLTGSETRLTNQLTTMDGDIDKVITDAKNEEMAYLRTTLTEMNTTINTIDTRTTDIKTNVDWIKSNAMNGGDRAAIDARFNTVDSDIDAMQAMCGNELTANSQLCQEIFSLKGNMSALRSENTGYYTKIDTTTTNTYNLLSGSISTRIDSLLTTVGLIKADTASIKGTVEDIRADQQNQVNIHIIS
jgi:hypothetical protein